MTPAKKKNELPFDGYIRVSRVGDRTGAAFISPAVQRETIERLAAYHGITLGEIVEELDVSGGKEIDSRDLGRLTKKVADGESGGLLVWKVSRFSRDLLDGITVATKIREGGGRIIGDDLDSSAPMGRAILGFLLGWAEEEREARAEGWKQAGVRAAARGAYPTRTPVGYTRDDDSRLVVDEPVAKAVRECFELRAKGGPAGSLQKCADHLSAATGRSHSKSAMPGMFKSPVYLGRIVIGEGIYQDGTHAAIVDERTWTLAQRAGQAPTHNGSLAGVGVLAGFCTCAGCGRLLQVTASGPKGARVPSYSCRKNSAAGTCPAPASIVVEKLDALVLPKLDEFKAGHARTFDDFMTATEDSALALELATQELDDFLGAALVSALGAERYAAEVTRRREAVEAAQLAYQADHDRGRALIDSEVDGLAHDRAVARTLLDSVTVAKSDPARGRWQPIEERVEITWAAEVAAA